MMKKKKVLIFVLVPIAILFAIVKLFPTLIIESYSVPSSSMEDTVLIGDHVLANMLAYGINNPLKPEKKFAQFRDPKRGDVVVHLYPESPSRRFFKRIVGLPNEELEIRVNQVYINGSPLDEPYKVHKSEYAGFISPNFGPVMVPPGYYFVLGDNRENSKDSRAWGFVPRSYILGRAFVVYWSFEPGGGPRWKRFGKPIR